MMIRALRATVAAVLGAAVFICAPVWASPPNNTIPGVTPTSGDVLLCSGTPWVDVRCNGADPTDTTDSTTAIQTTISQALLGPYPIKFPAGKYKVSSTLTIDTSGLATSGLKIISDNATIDGVSVASGPVLLIQRSGGTTGSPAVDQNFAIEGALTVLGSNGAYVVQIGKNDFSDKFQGLRVEHLIANNASSSASAGGVKVNFVVAGDLWLSGVTSGGAASVAAVALEQVQDSRIAGAGAAAGASAASLLLENGASLGNTVAGFSYGSASNTCLSITSSTATPNVFVQPNGGCTTGINFSQSGLSETLIGMNFTGTNVGPVSSGAIVLGRGLGAYTAPAVSSYTALCSDDGRVISSANATGSPAGWASTSLPVTLPSAVACGAHWRMSFVTDGGKAVTLTSAGGQHIIAGTQSLSTMTLGPGNYEFVTVRSDGANMRISASSPGSLVYNGAALPGVPANWEYPGGPGYQATQGDAAAEISSALTSGGLTVTLPSTTAIAKGWTIGLSPDGQPLTVQTNSVSGGNMLWGNGVQVFSPQVLAGLTWVQFDGANFRILGPVTRTMLLTESSIYVTPTGQDVGDCTQAEPCLTLQYACNQAMQTYDLHGNQLFIMVADGTYHAGCTIAGPMVGAAGAMPTAIVILGDETTPDNVEIDDTTNAVAAFQAQNGAIVTLDGMRIDSANGSATYPQIGAELGLENIDFGTTHFGHMHAETGGVTAVFGNYSISGDAPAHIENVLGGSTRFSEIPITVTVNGTRTFSNAFVSEAETSTVYMVNCLGGSGCPGSNGFGVTYAGSGTINGLRCHLQGNSVLETEDGTPSTFPPGTGSCLITGGAFYSPTGNIPGRWSTSTIGATLYVNGATGSDLVGSAPNLCENINFPCATIAQACAQVPSHDMGNNASLIIAIAGANYSAGCTIAGPSNGSQFSSGLNPTHALPVIIEGPFSGTPAVVNDSTGASAAFLFSSGVDVEIINLTIASTTHDGLLAINGARVFQQNNIFSACPAGAQMDAKDKATITSFGSYGVSGGALQHMLGERGGEIVDAAGITVTLTGTPAWGLNGIQLDDLSNVDIPSSVTFTGPATGSRYNVTGNSVLDAHGASASLPGSSAGTTASGGQVE